MEKNFIKLLFFSKPDVNKVVCYREIQFTDLWYVSLLEARLETVDGTEEKYVSLLSRFSRCENFMNVYMRIHTSRTHELD